MSRKELSETCVVNSKTSTKKRISLNKLTMLILSKTQVVNSTLRENV